MTRHFKRQKVQRQKPLKGGRPRANCYLHPQLLDALRDLAWEVDKSMSYTLATIMADYCRFHEGVLDFKRSARQSAAAHGQFPPRKRA